MKRIISIILTLIMVFSLGVAAFAEPAETADTEAAVEPTGENHKLVYTALGDSTSNGYGLAEYKMEERIYKYAQDVKQSYPSMFSRALCADVFYQDCLAGLRSEDMLYLIDENYDGDEYTHYQAFGDYVMNDLKRDKIDGITITDPQQLRDAYTKHVKEADVITLDIGLNNFGQFIKKQIEFYRATGKACSMDFDSEMEAMLTTKMFEGMRDGFLKILHVLHIGDMGLADVALRSMVYSYVDNFRAFDRIIDRIYELNPDVDLYVLGLYNSFSELYLIGKTVDIGQYYAQLLQGVNKHYEDYGENYPGYSYTYVDIFNVETFGLPTALVGTDFMNALTADNNRNAHPNYNGHVYMYEQIAKKATENGWVLNDTAARDFSMKLPFTDVSVDDWFYKGVRYCFDNDITRGTTDTLFSPNNIVTRAQLATFIYRLAGMPTISDKSEPFSDVSDAYWAHDAIAWAYHRGIIRGFSETTFAPDNPITRGQCVTMLCRYVGPIINSSSYAQFKDANTIPADFQSAVSWAVDNNIVQGYSNGTFRQGNALSRAEMVTILARLAGEG